MEDITAVNKTQPDYIGFVFAKSRRRVDRDTAVMLKKYLDSRIKAVGVFVNEEIKTIVDLYENGIIDWVQLHGDEDDGYIKRLKNTCGCTVIKAIPIGGDFPFLPNELPNEPDYLLFDTLSEQRGGTGKVFDWNVLRNFKGKPYFLAGGLTVSNVTRAIMLLSPFCVDVSGGVESNGTKDAQKIEDFINTVRRETP
jgi:phosphoribosylanthranilate isomerase